MFLIDDILKAPGKGLFSVFKTIHDRVEDELYNPDKIREDLMNLQMKLEMEEISEEEYEEQEEELLDRLDEAQRRQRQNQ